MAKLRIPEEVMAYFRKTGSMGGKARAEKHSLEQLSAWGKMGGRPKGSGKKQAASHSETKKRQSGGGRPRRNSADREEARGKEGRA